MRRFCLVKPLINEDPKIREISVRKLEKCLRCIGAKNRRSIMFHNLLAVGITILFLKLTVALNINFDTE